MAIYCSKNRRRTILRIQFEFHITLGEIQTRLNIEKPVTKFRIKVPQVQPDVNSKNLRMIKHKHIFLSQTNLSLPRVENRQKYKPSRNKKYKKNRPRKKNITSHCNAALATQLARQRQLNYRAYLAFLSDPRQVFSILHCKKKMEHPFVRILLILKLFIAQITDVLS